jgi:hypothetical protein
LAPPPALLELPPAGVLAPPELPPDFFELLLHPLMTVAAATPTVTRTSARLRIAVTPFTTGAVAHLNVVRANISGRGDDH